MPIDVKKVHPLFDQILTDFVQQEPAELQALPTRNEIYLEYHESREDMREVKIEGETK